MKALQESLRDLINITCDNNYFVCKLVH